MSALPFFLRLSWNNLRRGGQRVFVAVLCIAFGVMSLVAMTLVAQAFARAVILEPAEIFGGDLSLRRPAEEYLASEHVEELEAVRQAGEIHAYTLIALSSSLTYRLPGSGEMHFAASGMGIEPGLYPLAGTLSLCAPGNVGAATLLQEVGDVLVTRDIAEENAMHVGDPLLLADLHTGQPVAGTVRGIACDTPNHQGSKIYYTLATARELANGRQAVNVALALAGDPLAASRKLEASGWQASLAAGLAERDHAAQDLFDLLFKGAGILGLLVGGIGVSNTMQVLLRRRQREIAVWKALGYTESQLQALFALEAALLGLAGSLLGGGLGLAISFSLVQVFSRSTNLLIAWAFSPVAVVSGIFVGLLTTVIFALWAIVIASRARPMALLRNEPVEAGRLPWPKAIGLALVLALPFTAVTSLVMGSLLKGAGVLLFALLGLGVLGGLFGLGLWAAARLLPLGGLPLVRMARTSLRRRGLSLVFATIALFTGIVTLALGVVVTDSAAKEMAQRVPEIAGVNLQVIAPAGQEKAVRQALETQKVDRAALGYRIPVRAISGSNGEELGEIHPVLVGLEAPGNYAIQGAPWGSQPGGVYAPDIAGLTAGSQVTVAFWDGRAESLPVVGTYEFVRSAASLPPELGLLMPASLSASLAEPETVTFFLEVPGGRLGKVAAALGRALPGATVINLAAYAARYTLVYHNLFILALCMAGLALLAGVLLVANSVSLAMLDRRYEIGVLKAVGYSRLHILTTLAVEYSLVGLIAALAGLAAVQVFLWALALINGLAGSLLVLSPFAAILIGLLGVGLVLLTVLGVTWGPTRVSPVVVLNERL